MRSLLTGVSILVVCTLLFGCAAPVSTGDKGGVAGKVGEELERGNIIYRLTDDTLAGGAFDLEPLALTQAQLTALDALVAEHPESSFQKNEDGTFWYDDAACSGADASTGMTMTQAEAIEKAESVLSSLHLLPEQEYITQASAVSRAASTDLGEGFGNSVVVSYTVRFSLSYKGLPVVCAPHHYSGITVEITDKGVASIYYRWCKLISLEDISTDNFISAETAFEAYEATQFGSYRMTDTRLTSPSLTPEMQRQWRTVAYQQVYVYDGEQSRPAWMFHESKKLFLNAIYIDAVTGTEFEI